jgi:hypothetical protein
MVRRANSPWLASSVSANPNLVQTVFFNGLSDGLFIGLLADGCIFLTPLNQPGLDRKLPVLANVPFQFEPERGPIIRWSSSATLGRSAARLRHLESAFRLISSIARLIALTFAISSCTRFKAALSKDLSILRKAATAALFAAKRDA